MKVFYRTRKQEILNPKGRPVILKGVNIGGWLMMEGYIMQAPNRAEQLFKKGFVKKLGPRALDDLEKSFRDNFIRRDDLVMMAKLGVNCIRVPFNFRLIETKLFQYDLKGFTYLDAVIRWGKELGIAIILDLHAAPGAQNHDWHSDSLGPAELWTNKRNQERTYALWEIIANRYKDEENIAGYDVLNEAVTKDVKTLNRFYKTLIKRIRAVDRNHSLYIEGNIWAQDLDSLDEFEDDNIVYSIHYYEPNELSFHLVNHMKYPWKTPHGRADRSMILKKFEGYEHFARKRHAPIFAGEFGVNYRQGHYGEDVWLKDVLSIFNQFQWHWSYWTWKAIKNNLHPDGLYSYYPNPPWVNRQGPLTGWETWAQHWPTRKNEIIKSWRTQEFQSNSAVLDVLRHAICTCFP